MSISLFPHNQKAYEAAKQMLRECGKAAIIHPTGTGKSFIGFKFCEDNPQSNVSWLSPSAYIFGTQIENIKKATNGWTPNNVTFHTYQKLLLMDDNEISELKPDLIILDEFHRCGAEMWGAGVSRLLDRFPSIPVLGLSATSIRYLDNQRDMADELFEGNIASELTLGEAVVRGILKAPKYILTAYSYQEDLKRYEKRLHTIQNQAVFDKATAYLKALRRSLEMAEGLDAVFAKHMTSTGGKYIVFCANLQHMKEMISLAPVWFSKVDSSAHIYKAYSSDPETSKAFADFKADDSTHLKLLYCIDMLNEGVHVDDIDGVILLRPTVSPIVYKQQIGRTMSAGNTKEVSVFDVVMNINNLYSVGSIQEEMDTAVGYYISHGEDGKIVKKHFEIFDELLDCRSLFSRLEETLSASWDIMYAFAAEYFHKHGDLNAPNDYRTEEGYALGVWLLRQRNVRKGTVPGILTDEQIDKLDRIGMPWEGVIGGRWQRNYEALCHYYHKNGNINVPNSYITDSGIRLGAWVRKMRKAHANCTRRDYLTPERIKLLDELGMIWEKKDYLWDRNYKAAADYYQTHGSIKMPHNYRSAEGIGLGRWIDHILQVYRDTFGASLSESQIKKLKEIGLGLPSKQELEEMWRKNYLEAEAYFQDKGNLNVPLLYKSASGFALGRWIAHERRSAQYGTASRPYPEWHRNALNQIGMTWEREKPDIWSLNYELARKYFLSYGDLNLSSSATIEGVHLGHWLIQQRSLYRHGKLDEKSVRQLESIGIVWGEKSVQQWEDHYALAKHFFEENGHLYVPARMKDLYNWLISQRKKQTTGKLSEMQIACLNKIGMRW